MSSQTRIDFYHLSATESRARLLFTCKLVDKAYRQGLTVQVCLPDSAEAGRLDEMMWTFNEGSFIPHQRLEGDADAESPVVISGHCGPAGSRAFDLLVNLGTDIAAEPAGYKRIAEIMTSDAVDLQHGRKRYSYYKNAGLPLHYHEIAM